MIKALAISFARCFRFFKVVAMRCATEEDARRLLRDAKLAQMAFAGRRSKSLLRCNRGSTSPASHDLIVESCWVGIENKYEEIHALWDSLDRLRHHSLYSYSIQGRKNGPRIHAKSDKTNSRS